MLPDLTDDERRANLKKALKIKSERVAVKAALANGDITFESALGTGCMQREPVSRLLQVLHGVGPARAARIMDECGIASGRRVSGLGRLQRERLLKAVAEWESTK